MILDFRKKKAKIYRVERRKSEKESENRTNQSTTFEFEKKGQC